MKSPTGPGSMVGWRLMTAVCLAWLAGGVYSAAAEESTAHMLLLKGRYTEAAQWYLRDISTDPAAAIGLGRCKLATGKRDEAQAALQTAAETFPTSAAVRAELGLLALGRGDQDAAEKLAAAALALDKDCAAAHWVHAELLLRAGKVTEAQTAYAWFIEYYNRAPRINDPEDLLWIARGASQHARWSRNSNQFQRLINEVFPAALRLSPNF